MLSDSEKEGITKIAHNRFNSKRTAGISEVRSDGSVCSENNDLDATGAEYYCAKLCGQPFDTSISITGDLGHDFILNGKTVEVVWLGRDKKTNKPRNTGNLIVNPHEPKRWADIYIVIGGGFDEGYHMLGWTDHKSLIQMPKVNFGFGIRYAMNIYALNADINELLTL